MVAMLMMCVVLMCLQCGLMGFLAAKSVFQKPKEPSIPRSAEEVRKEEKRLQRLAEETQNFLTYDGSPQDSNF